MIPVEEILLDIQKLPELKEFFTRDAAIVRNVATNVSANALARESVLELKMAFIEQVAQQLRRRNSSNSSFEKHDVPIEIVLEIVIMDLPVIGFETQIGCDRYFLRLQSLALVSTFFRDLMHHTPALWSVATNTTPLWLVEQALQKSLQCPLVIEMEDLQAPTVRRSYPSGHDFVDLVAPHMSRCRGLKIQHWSGPETQEIVELAAPELRWAALSSFTAPLPPLRPFSGRADQLRQLRLVGSRFAWDAISFPLLEDLRLSTVTYSDFNRPSLSNVIQWLTVSCNLVHIDLTNTELAPNMSPSNMAPVHLSRLSTLRLNGNRSPSDTACSVLPLIQAPALSKFFFSFDLFFKPDSTRTLLPHALTHFVPNILTAFQRSKFAKVEVLKAYVGLSLSHDSRDHQLCFFSDEPGAIIQWLASSLSPIINSDLISLGIKFGDGYPSSSSLVPILFDSLPHLRHLTIDTHFPSANLLGALGEPRLNTDGVLTYPFPKLSTLALSTACKPDVVLEALSKRYGRVTGMQREAEQPAPLAQLSLNGLKDWLKESRQRLATLMGEASLNDTHHTTYTEYNMDGTLTSRSIKMSKLIELRSRREAQRLAEQAAMASGGSVGREGLSQD